MRAIFYLFNSNDQHEPVVLKDEAFNHLMVARVKPNEKILLLNGEGEMALSTILSISKKEIILKIDSCEKRSRLHQLSLAVALPKKDAFEDILKIAVELGVDQIFLLSSDYSQYELKDENSDRMQRLIQSAMIQSNNPYSPKLHPQISLEKFLQSHSAPIFFFNSRPAGCGKPIKISSNSKVTILIGPEGGFSSHEEEILTNLSNVFSIHLNTPILRAPTATAAAFGHLLSFLKE